MENKLLNPDFQSQIVELLQVARNKVVQTVNFTMVSVYFEIGHKIVTEEQKGNDRAQYGKKLIEGLSTALTSEFGKGFSVTNLRQMRSFYLAYRIPQTVSAELNQSQNFTLSWSHYLILMRIEDVNERSFYEIESNQNRWSVRELQRQFNSALYTRLALSRDKKEIEKLSQEGQIIVKPSDAIKDPYILEFVGLEDRNTYSENDLESELINRLEDFLLELGKGFTFVGRQKRISFEEKHFRIDLVFYNRILKSFVLIDLKIGELKHQDIGQMQMYVNYFDREIKLQDENKTIGIIFCRNKSESVVKYTLPEDNEQIFASKYKTVLPSKEKLKELLGDK